MKAKIIDTKILKPGDNAVIDLKIKSDSKYYIVARFYAIPNPPEGASPDERKERFSRVAKWLSSENLNI